MLMTYETVIGLEVHVQLGTRTKMLCRCSAMDSRSVETAIPNSSICPVCTGQPGTLPVLNHTAVELGMKAAIALGCRMRERSVFARKNYFYPDLPKNYQISQYDEPLAENGSIEIDMQSSGDGTVVKRIGIARLHLEEDAGKLLHATGSEELNHSFVDFNRCGMPLAEIVSEPDMRSPEEAYQYLTELKNILQWIGVSNCDMERGELRCDVNLSVRPVGQKELGTKVEIKNLNSFKAVKDALFYEISRQKKSVSAGERIIQETRLWDEKGGITASMRSKEEAHDYRYFSDPDLVPLCPGKEWIENIRADIPELPRQRKERFIKDYNLPAYDAGVLTSSRGLAEYFEKCVKTGAKPKIASNWINTELLGRLNAEKIEITDSAVSPESMAGLTNLVESGKISGKMGKEVFGQMWKTGKSAKEIVEASGLSQVSDEGQIEVWAKEAVSENPVAAEDYRKGNEKAIGALVGVMMRKSKGKANPAVANSILKKILGQ